MLAIKIWNYFKGYVIIRVEGLTLERLLNLATKYDIYLWDIKRCNSIVLEMKSSIKGFKELKQIVKKVGCRVEIKEKVGLPFLISELKSRKLWVFSFLLSLIIVFFLFSTIWEIHIIGNEQTPKEEIISLLKDKNIFVGKLKFNVDKEELKDLLNEKYDYLSFVMVNIKGTTLNIEIKEQDLPPEKIDKSYPCHIVAKKKGVILKVTAKNGEAMVEKGNVVVQGETLISGIINSEDNILVHSEGEVLALTRYTSMVKEPIIKNEEKPTGNVFNEKGVKIRSRGIQFIKGQIPFENYKEEIIEKDLINLKKYGIDFPIKIVNYKYEEVELKEIKQNIDYIKNANQIAATREINKELPKDAEIQSKNTRHQIDNNILTTQVIIEAIEDIGKKQIIE